MKSISTAQINQIISFLDLGQSTCQIYDSTDIHHSTISRIHSKLHPNLAKSFGGCPTLITPADMHHAIYLIGTGKAENAVQVTKTLQDVKNHTISSQIICCHLKKAGMKAVAKKKCPHLKSAHKKARLDFGKSYQHWTVEDWKQVIWSDETKINSIGSDGKRSAWKKAGEDLSDRLVQGTVKFGGGSLMMWDCMTWKGVGMACKIDGRMDTDLYLQIMKNELQQTLEYFGKTPDDIVF